MSTFELSWLANWLTREKEEMGIRPFSGGFLPFAWHDVTGKQGDDNVLRVPIARFRWFIDV